MSWWSHWLDLLGTKLLQIEGRFTNSWVTITRLYDLILTHACHGGATAILTLLFAWTYQVNGRNRWTADALFFGGGFFITPLPPPTHTIILFYCEVWMNGSLWSCNPPPKSQSIALGVGGAWVELWNFHRLWVTDPLTQMTHKMDSILSEMKSETVLKNRLCKTKEQCALSPTITQSRGINELRSGLLGK